MVDEARAARRSACSARRPPGPGGICFALRTIPEMVELAETVAERAPGAWVINFTNPAGMVTEALQQVLGDRVVGICDSPSASAGASPRAVGREPGEMWFDYFGLNHLGWLRGAHDADARPPPGAARRRRDARRPSRRAACSAATGCARSG